MDEDDFKDYERRTRLYHNAFEEYDSLKTTYTQFYEASSSLKRRGHVVTYGSTLFGAILLYLVGTVALEGGSGFKTELVFAVSIAVTALSFYNAVDSPQQMANVTYNSGQTLQRVFLDFHYFITVELPEPDNDIEELEGQYERLLERKHTVNETTPQLGNKWYRRVKEGRDSWEPIPLTEITGEDKEFVKEDDGDEEESEGIIQRAWSGVTSPAGRILRFFGF